MSERSEEQPARAEPRALAVESVTGTEWRAEAPTAMILHGIMGSGSNWRSFARRWVDARPGWRVLLPDLRNHGDSHGFSSPHTIARCAEDARAVCAAHAPVTTVVGHSFGGKVALELGRERPSGLRQIVSLDSPPGPRVGPGSGAEAVIASLRRVRLPLRRRAEVVEILSEMGLPDAIGRWMTTNLRRVEGGLVWTFDLDAVEAMMASFAEYDGWETIAGLAEGADPPDLHLVRGARSEVWSEADEDRLLAFERAAPGQVHTLADAGHWVHADNPDGLWSLLDSVIQDGAAARR